MHDRPSALLLAVLFSASVLAASTEFRMSSKGWLVNTFRKPGARADLRFVKGPDGRDAVRATVRGRSVNIIYPKAELHRQRAAWPERVGGAGAFVWNDGKRHRFGFAFRTKARDQFNAILSTDHKGWEFVRFPGPINFKNKQQRINPREMDSMFFHVTGEDGREVGVGTIFWEPDGLELSPTMAGMTATARPTSVPPQLDGDLTDAAWRGAAEAPLAYRCRGAAKPIWPARARVTYDSRAFYAAVEAFHRKGENLKARKTEHDSGLWQEEDVELFLHPTLDPRLFYQFFVNPLNTLAEYAKVFDQVADRIAMKTSWNGPWRSAVKRGADRWTAEVAIPWKTLGLDGPPERLAFQAMRGDHTGPRPEYVVWSPVRRNPWIGVGVLNLQTRKPAALELSGLRARAPQPGRVWVTGVLKRTGKAAPVGRVRLRAWLADPYQPPRSWRREVEFPGAWGRLDWELAYKGPVSGHHRLVIQADPVAGDAESATGLLRFRLDLPSRVAFGEPVLLPRPKELKWGRGAFTLREGDVIRVPANGPLRTLRTAKLLADRLDGHFGCRPSVQPGAATARLDLRVDPKAVRAHVGRDTDEAYLLDVTPEGLRITGAGQRGLYYGVVTLTQLMESPKAPNVPLRAVSVRDWPAYPWRVFHEWIHGPVRRAKNQGGYEIARMKRMIERVAAGSKFNLIVLQVDRSFAFASHPEWTSSRDFTPVEYRELCDFAREHFLEVVPAMHYGSHSFVAIVDKRYREEGHLYNQQDVTKPGTYKLMRELYSDVIAAAGKPVRFFHTMNDEWWQRPTGKRRRVHNGMTRQAIFQRHVLNEHEALKSHGLRMIMFCDMLLPNHGGGPPMNLWKVADALPRDIVMATWSYKPTRLRKLGFETWQVDNSFIACDRDPGPEAQGYGNLVYRCAYSLFGFISYARNAAFSHHAILRTAEFAWNRKNHTNLPLEPWVLENMPNLMGVYAARPNPAAGRARVPVAFDSDAKLVEELGLPAEGEVGGVPTRPRAMRVRAGTDGIVKFPGGTRAASVLLLHGLEVPTAQARGALRKEARRLQANGLPAGSYRLVYADGAKAELGLMLGINVIELDCPAPNRYVLEGRCVYPLGKGAKRALLQIEWVNPCPGKSIERLEIAAGHKAAPLILSGVTLRGVRP